MAWTNTWATRATKLAHAHRARLAGVDKRFEEQQRQPDVAALSDDERLLLVDCEDLKRENLRLVSHLKLVVGK